MLFDGKKTFTIILVVITMLTTSALLRYTKRKNHNHHDLGPHIILVGTNAQYQPFTFVKNGKIIGFDIDLVFELGKRLGKKIALQDMSFEALMSNIVEGNIHLIAAGMTETPERAEQVFFSKPYLTGDPLIIVSLQQKPVGSLEELNDKKVIVNEGFTAEKFMATIKGPQLQRVKTVTEAFTELEQGTVDALVTAHSSAQLFFNQYDKDHFHIVQIPNTSENYSFAISENYPALKHAIDCSLLEMKEDGTLESLKRKWGL